MVKDLLRCLFMKKMSDPVKLKLLADFELILYFIERIDRKPIESEPELLVDYFLLKEDCDIIIDYLKETLL